MTKAEGAKDALAQGAQGAQGARRARVSTGVEGLDIVLHGGLLPRNIYIVMGRPGAGKTILGNQICYTHVRSGGRALYVTLLAEMHEAMLEHIGRLGFFDPAAVGSSLVYLNGYAALDQGGLDALLKLLRQGLREHRASLLIIDGMITAALFAKSDIDYKRFLQEMQSWASLMGVTVLFLTSSDTGTTSAPEHTMVDGIIELRSSPFQKRCLRELTVTKVRGDSFLEGRHEYVITDEGMHVYPRPEALLSRPREGRYSDRRLESGIPGFDALMEGGLVEGSTTLLLGSSGTGKTVIGLQFLNTGAQAGEPVLHVGSLESPAALRGKGRRLGLDFGERGGRDNLIVHWHPSAELSLDAMMNNLLTVVRARGIRRLLLDGLAGFKSASPYPERMSSLFAVITEELQQLGVTTMLTEETRELFVRHIEVPTPGVSAICHNIVFLRKVEIEAELQWVISVMKTRDTGHARGLYHFDITDRGVVIGEKFSPMQNVLSGVTSQARAPSIRSRKPAGRKKMTSKSGK